jgi:hypothetical protein
MEFVDGSLDGSCPIHLAWREGIILDGKFKFSLMWLSFLEFFLLGGNLVKLPKE